MLYVNWCGDFHNQIVLGFFFLHEGNFKSQFVDDILSGLILGGKTEESKSQEINERKPSKT